MQVYLSENAFLPILVSCVEVYRKKCLGVLLGHREADRIVVDFAVPYQSARRQYRNVHVVGTRSQRVAEAVATISRWTRVGAFHSQGQVRTHRATTRLTREYQAECGDQEIALVVAINDSVRQVRWGYVRGGILSGSVNGFALRLAAYHRAGETLSRVPLLSPYALGCMAKRKDERPVEVRVD